MAAAAPSDLKIGFLGAGMMATALMDGLISKGVVAADAISCSDPWDKVGFPTAATTASTATTATAATAATTGTRRASGRRPRASTRPSQTRTWCSARTWS